MTIYRERLLSVISYGIVDVIGRLFRLSFLPLLAWIIEPEEYGKISLFISFTVFVSILVSYNLTNYIRHITLKRATELVYYLSTIYITTILIGSFLTLLFSYNQYLVKLILFSVCISIQNGAASYYLALGKKFQYLGFTFLVNSLGYAVPLLIVYIKQEEDFLSIISTVLIFQFVTTLGALTFLLIKGLIKFKSFRKSILIELLRLNTPLLINSSAGIGLIYIDRIFIEYHHGFNTLGQYTFIYNSYLVYGLLIQSIVNDFIPKYYSELNNKRREIALKMIASYHRFGILFIPVGLSLFFLLEHYKPKGYYIDRTAFIILTCSAIFQLFYSLNVNKLHYFEKTVKVLKATSLAFLLNLFFNAILVPEVGQTGAAIATLLGYSSLYYFVHKYSKNV